VAGCADAEHPRLRGRRATRAGADADQPGAGGGGHAPDTPPPYSEAGVFTQMYSVTSLLGLATRCGVELAKKIESPGSRK
jgi:hypothetical protein